MIFSGMCLQAFVIGVKRIIKILNPFFANRAPNRTAICSQNQTRIYGPFKGTGEPRGAPYKELVKKGVSLLRNW
jgi:hypothetical protein